MNNSSNTSGGIGFFGALLITFIILKLCKVINWSWWWVLSPIWLWALTIITIILIIILLRR